MRRKPRNVLYLILGITGASVNAWFVNTYEPVSQWVIVLFFFLITSAAFFLLLFALNNVRRAVWGSAALVLFLLLRYLGLRHPGYILLLAATLVSLELSLQKR